GATGTGMAAVREFMAQVPAGFGGAGSRQGDQDGIEGAAERPAPRPLMAAPSSAAGGMGRRRVLVHSSGFAMSPYSDVRPAGEDTKDVARSVWHRGPGSAA